MTKTNPATAGSRNDEKAKELLPMYVAGALSAEERSAVEALCAANPLLQRELEAEKLLAAAIREDEPMPPPVERSLATMNARIDAYEQRQGGLGVWIENIGERLAALVGSFRPAFALPVGAAAALLLAVLVWPGEPAREGNSFSTATDAPGHVAVEGPVLRIKLADGAGADALADLLTRYKLAVVGDAQPSAVVTLRPLVAGDAQRIADALALEPAVDFATVREAQ